MSSARLDIYADITCPFAHVGLKRVLDELGDLSEQIEIVARAWPLEWVNGTPLEAASVEQKIGALRDQLGIELFAKFDPDAWPASTIPALNLAAEGFAVDTATGLGVSLAVRDALFEEGRDVGDPEVLAALAERFGLDAPAEEATDRVRSEFDEGRRRGVRGSPDFWLGDAEFFCPSLTLGNDDGVLTAEFDGDGMQHFLDHVRSSIAS